jgi:hypothetical protein
MITVPVLWNTLAKKIRKKIKVIQTKLKPNRSEKAPEFQNFLK